MLNYDRKKIQRKAKRALVWEIFKTRNEVYYVIAFNYVIIIIIIIIIFTMSTIISEKPLKTY